MSDEVSELQALLLYRGRPDPRPDGWVRAWESWDYNCRIEHQGPEGADVFKGGAFTIVRFAQGKPDLPWDDLEQQAALLAGVADTFDHAAALATALASDHHATVTVRILEPGPWIILTEILIALSGLVEATGATAVWLPHCQTLVAADDFRADAEALRLDDRGRSTHPYSLYMSVQLRLPLDRGESAVGARAGAFRLARLRDRRFRARADTRRPLPDARQHGDASTRAKGRHRRGRVHRVVDGPHRHRHDEAQPQLRRRRASPVLPRLMPADPTGRTTDRVTQSQRQSRLTLFHLPR